VISCRDVSLSYDGRPAVEGVSFDVSRGDYLCIVGENGSGKSTLMKCLLGLLRPSGTIAFDGLGRRDIGYLPQQTVIQRDFPASVHEVVMSGRINRRGPFSFYSRADRSRVDECIERLGISGFRDKSYRDLSGGQRQRVLLARALVASERVIMLDEPVSGLDPVIAAEVYDLLEALNREGMTIVMISHDIRGAVRYGNKILHMRVSPLFCGAADDYLKTDVYRRLAGGE
jgi:zinc transport system ATP-binding protein